MSAISNTPASNTLATVLSAPTLATQANQSNDELLLELSLLRTQYAQNQQIHNLKAAQLDNRYCQLRQEEQSLRVQLQIARDAQHFQKVAEFWQDFEVAQPNKLVAVPRALLIKEKRSEQSMEKKITTIALQEAVKLKHFESYQSGESTSISSGRSNEGTETTKPTNTTTKLMSMFSDCNEPDQDQDPEPIDRRVGVEVEGKIAAGVAVAAAF